METTAFIRSLAAQIGPAPKGGVARLRLHLAAASALGVALLVAAVLIGLGARPDLGRSVFTEAVAGKLGLGIGLAALAHPLLVRLIQPGAPMPSWGIALFALPVLALLAGTGASAPPVASAALCSISVAILALAPLAMLLAVLRKGAPVRPALAGAMAGILSGGLATCAYALFCPLNFSPVVVLFYMAGVAAAAAIGALAGQRVLAW